MLGMVFLARAVDEVGRAKFKNQWKEGLSPYSREKVDRDLFAKAAEVLATSLAEGKVSYFLRGISGGPYSKSLPADRWINDDLLTYFYDCKMTSQALGASGLGELWIFVAMESLSLVLAPTAEVPPKPKPGQIAASKPKVKYSAAQLDAFLTDINARWNKAPNSIDARLDFGFTEEAEKALPGVSGYAIRKLWKKFHGRNSRHHEK